LHNYIKAPPEEEDDMKTAFMALLVLVGSTVNTYGSSSGIDKSSPRALATVMGAKLVLHDKKCLKKDVSTDPTCTTARKTAHDCLVGLNEAYNDNSSNCVDFRASVIQRFELASSTKVDDFTQMTPEQQHEVFQKISDANFGSPK
jgi:hypothetical protein